MTDSELLAQTAKELAAKAALVEQPTFNAPLKRLEDAAASVGRAWSGSWLGYHARVYYARFEVPPAGARFSQEWGFMSGTSRASHGDWKEFRYEDVIDVIEKLAGSPDLSEQMRTSEETAEFFEDAQATIVSRLTTAQRRDPDDTFVAKLFKSAEELKIYQANDFVRLTRPTGQLMSRDIAAVEKGLSTPPHVAAAARVVAMRQPFEACRQLSKLADRAGQHLANQDSRARIQSRIGVNVFIGHGRAADWKDLRDFLRDRLQLPWDEFNRVPVAGVANIARLSQMLDAAAIAFLVMTAEDEQVDGQLHARMNVVHEAGLFQGRLGFERAIVLIEEGCQEFSNIQGLGQIRFPRGNITAVFEDIRLVLEREGIVE